FFTLVSYVISHIPEASLPVAWQKEQQKKEKQQYERNHEQVYLRWLANEVTVLPRLGLGVDLHSLPQSVQLADVFIPLEFRASPKGIKLQPCTQDELKHVAGLDRQHEYYLMVDEKGEWERNQNSSALSRQLA